MTFVVVDTIGALTLLKNYESNEYYVTDQDYSLNPDSPKPLIDAYGYTITDTGYPDYLKAFFATTENGSNIALFKSLDNLIVEWTFDSSWQHPASAAGISLQSKELFNLETHFNRDLNADNKIGFPADWWTPVDTVGGVTLLKEKNSNQYYVTDTDYKQYPANPKPLIDYLGYIISDSGYPNYLKAFFATTENGSNIALFKTSDNQIVEWTFDSSWQHPTSSAGISLQSKELFNLETHFDRDLNADNKIGFPADWWTPVDTVGGVTLLKEKNSNQYYVTDTDYKQYPANPKPLIDYLGYIISDSGYPNYLKAFFATTENGSNIALFKTSDNQIVEWTFDSSWQHPTSSAGISLQSKELFNLETHFDRDLNADNKIGFPADWWTPVDTVGGVTLLKEKNSNQYYVTDTDYKQYPANPKPLIDYLGYIISDSGYPNYLKAFFATTENGSNIALFKTSDNQIVEWTFDSSWQHPTSSAGISLQSKELFNLETHFDRDLNADNKIGFPADWWTPVDTVGGVTLLKEKNSNQYYVTDTDYKQYPANPKPLIDYLGYIISDSGYPNYLKAFFATTENGSNIALFKTSDNQIVEWTFDSSWQHPTSSAGISLQSKELFNLETHFDRDLNADNKIGFPADWWTPVDTVGGVTLLKEKNSNQYYVTDTDYKQYPTNPKPLIDYLGYIISDSGYPNYLKAFFATTENGSNIALFKTSDNQIVEWTFDSSWQHPTSSAGISLQSKELFNLETHFDRDLNADNKIGFPADWWTPVDTVGGVTLLKEKNSNQYYVTDTDYKQYPANPKPLIDYLGYIISDSGYPNYLKAFFATTENGSNIALFKTSDNQIVEWTFDSSWQHPTSSAGISLQSKELFNLETHFDRDLNADNKIGFPADWWTPVDTVGGVTLLKEKNSNQYYVTDTDYKQYPANPKPLVDNYGYTISDSGYPNYLKAFFATTENGSNIAIFKTSDNQIVEWTFDSSWQHPTSSAGISLQSKELFNLETHFDRDLNADNKIGFPADWWTPVDTVGGVTLLKEKNSNQYYVTDTDYKQYPANPKPLVDNYGYTISDSGYPDYLKAFFATTENGSNIAIFKTSDNQIVEWTFDSSWQHPSAASFSLQSKELFILETHFNRDFNADGLIGNPVDYFQVDLISALPEVEEGQTLAVKASTNGIPTGTTLYWQTSGIGISDSSFLSDSSSGSAAVSADGQLSFSQILTNDRHTEGTRFIEISLFADQEHTRQLGRTTSVTLIDTSNGNLTKTWTRSIAGQSPTSISINDDGTFIASGVGFTAKYTADGKSIWNQDFGGYRTIRAIASTSDNYSYLVENDHWWVGGGSYLKRINQDGINQWSIPIVAHLEAVATFNGKAFVTGNSSYLSTNLDGAVDDRDGYGHAFVAAYNTDGTKYWSALISGTKSDVAGTGITTGKDGSIYVTGYTTGALDGNNHAGNGFDAFLCKYSFDGTRVWIKQVGGIGNDYATSVATAADGSIYISGFSDGSFDGQVNHSGKDIFLEKYDTNGTKQWSRFLGVLTTPYAPGNIYSNAITFGLDGAIYVSGKTLANINGTTTNYDPTLNNGTSKSFVSRFTQDGVLEWIEILGSGVSQSAALATAADGSIYVGGSDGNSGYLTRLEPNSLAQSIGCIIVPSTSTLEEGQTLAVKASTNGIPTGTTLYWQTSGIGISDSSFLSDSSSGSAAVSADGQLSFSQILTNDRHTEGTRFIEISLFADQEHTRQLGRTTSVTLIDTSNGNLTKTWTRSIAGQSPTSISINDDGTFIASGVGFTAKYTADGKSIWNQDFGGYRTIRAIASTSDNYSYLVENDHWWVGGGSYLKRINQDGINQWSIPIVAHLEAVATFNGKAFVTGNSSYLSTNLDGAVDDRDGYGHAFVAAYNTDGTKYWSALISGTKSDVAGTGITTGKDGSIYVTGYTTGALDGNNHAGNGFDAFLCKYSFDGTRLWARQIGGIGNDYATSVATAADGSIYISGFSDGSFDGQVNHSGKDIFLAKYDANGNKQWSRFLGVLTTPYAPGNIYSNAITFGLDGAIYVSGKTLANINGTSTNYDPTLNNGTSKSFVSRFTQDGVLEWIEILGSGVSQSAALATAADGSIYVGGSDGNGGYLTRLEPNSLAQSIGCIIVPSTSTLEEGQTLDVKVTTNGIPTGTTIYWQTSGIGISDSSFLSDSSSGSAAVSADGQLSFSQILTNDRHTEGTRFIEISLFADREHTRQLGRTTSVTLIDTSNGNLTKTWTRSIAGQSPTSISINDDGTFIASGVGFTAKYTADGKSIWNQDFGGYRTIRAIASTSDNYSYLVENDHWWVGGGSYLKRINQDGINQWSIPIVAHLEAVATFNGKAFVTGNSSYLSTNLDGAVDDRDGYGHAFVAAYNTDGTKFWSALISGTKSDVAGTGITTGKDGSIYVTGYTTGALDGNNHAGNGIDAFLCKYSYDGTRVWIKQVGGIGNDYATSVATAADGSIYISGFSDGSFDGQVNHSGKDIFLEKYDTNGTKQWSRFLGVLTTPYAPGNIYSNAITFGLDGAIYVSGKTLANINGTTTNYDPTLNNGTSKSFVSRFTQDGVQEWIEILGSGVSQSAALATAADGSIYVGGSDGNSGYLTRLEPNSLAQSIGCIIVPSASTLEEGQTLDVKVTTNGIPTGTIIYWQTSGLGISDSSFLSDSSSGSAAVSADGQLSFSQILTNDRHTEGTRFIEISLFADREHTRQLGRTTSVTLIDTSNGNLTKTWTRSIAGQSPTSISINDDGTFIASGVGFTAKYTADGKSIWNQDFGGYRTIRAIASTSDNYSYLVENDHWWVGGGSYLKRINQDGINQWSIPIVAHLEAVATFNGKAFVTGNSSYLSTNLDGAVDDRDGYGHAFVAAYNTDGTKYWSALISGTKSDVAGTGITTGKDGSIYVTGYTTGALDGNNHAGNGFDAFLCKYSYDGTRLWARQIGGIGNDYATSVATATDGSIYISGFSDGSFDGQVNHSGKDIFLAKYDANGNKQWSRFLGVSTTPYAPGNIYSNAITFGLDGAIYVSGKTLANINGTSTNYDPTLNNGTSKSFVSRFTQDGVQEWIEILGSGVSQSAALATAADGSIYVGGSDGNGGYVSKLLFAPQPPSITISTNYSRLKSGETALIYFTFSKDPGTSFEWDGTTGDINVFGGSLSSIQGSGLLRTAIFTPNSNINNGTVSIRVAADTYSDAAGNAGEAGKLTLLKFDTQAPSLAISSTASTLKSGETATITFTFSEDPGSSFAWDGTSGDVTVTGGSLSSISGSGLTRTAIFSPNTKTNSGTASISVAAKSYTDLAGNDGDGANSPTLTFDTQAPSLAISSTASILKSGETSTIMFTFSEDPGSSFAWDGTSGDVTVSGGSLSSISGSGLTRTAIFSPNTNTNSGTASISVAAKSYTDLAGNDGDVANSPTLTFDTQAPSLAISSTASTLKSGETATITFTFSEDPGSSFAWDGTSGDVTVSGGSLSSISGSGLTRTAIFSPNANTNSGTASISVAAKSYTDPAGNDGDVANSTALTFDTQPPSLAISSTASTLKSGETATITFTFSEDPGSSFAWDGTSGDVTVSGGSLSSISGSGLTRTAIFSPNANTNSGTASISVAAKSYTDPAGNDGDVANSPTLTFDTQAPSLAISSTASTLKSGETATITFTFSEDPGSSFAWDGTSGDVTVSGGSLSSISGSGLTRTAIFSPNANTNSGTASISVAAKSYTDPAGNDGDVANSTALTFDTQPPSLAISSTASTLKSGETATITFTFSEDPGSSFAWDGTSGDVTVTGGSLSSISGSGLSRIATFTPDNGVNHGTAAITVSSGTYTDAAGNSGGADDAPSLSFDTLAPSINRARGLTTTNASGTYGIGNRLFILVPFTEAVFVHGIPSLLLDTGINDHQAIYQSGSGTDTLTFVYNILLGDSSSDLDISSSSSLSLNGGSIQDTAGNASDLILPEPGSVGSLTNNATLVLQGNSPTGQTTIETSQGPVDLGIKATLTHQTIDPSTGGSIFSDTLLSFDTIVNDPTTTLQLQAIVSTTNPAITVLSSSDQIGFKVHPRVNAVGTISPDFLQATTNDANSLFSATIQEVDIGFSEANQGQPDWNALYKKRKNGDYYLFNYDLATGLGAMLVDQDGNGRIDGARLFLKDGALGDFDESVNGTIVDPIGLASLSQVPSLRLSKDNQGFSVEGVEGTGLWLTIGVSSFNANRQTCLDIYNSTSSDSYGSIGATVGGGVTGQKAIFLASGQSIKFHNSDGTDQTNVNPSLRITPTSFNSFSLGLDSNHDGRFDDLMLNISSTIAANSPADLVIARKQLSSFDAILDFTSIAADGIKLSLDISTDCSLHNRFGFVKLDPITGVTYQVNGNPTSAGASFRSAALTDFIDPFQGTTTSHRFGKSRQTISWQLDGSQAGCYAPVLITQGGEVLTFGASSASDGRQHVKLLGTNTFGFEDLLASQGSDWDFNDTKVRVSVA